MYIYVYTHIPYILYTGLLKRNGIPSKGSLLPTSGAAKPMGKYWHCFAGSPRVAGLNEVTSHSPMGGGLMAARKH